MVTVRAEISGTPPTPEAPASSEAPATPPTPPAQATRELPEDAEQQIAWLRGQVAALEAALERRSRELRLLQRLLCPRDLAQWARLAAGLPPLPVIACEPGYWRETTALTAAEVPETLAALWESLYPPAPLGPPAPPGHPGHSEPPEPLRPPEPPRPSRTPSR